MPVSLQQAPVHQPGCYRLQRRHLFTKKDFTRLFNSGQKKHTRLFIIFYLPIAAQTEPHLGIVVSKKHVKTSVRRNRVKRLLREYYRLHQHALHAWRIMCVSKAGLATASRTEIRLELDYIYSWMRGLKS